METQNEMDINALLEQESRSNKADSWNKLNKTLKIKKLEAFSEKYCKDNNLTSKDAKQLKQYFLSCLDDNKLQRTKDVQYDKETGEIINIPQFTYNKAAKNCTLKALDKKGLPQKCTKPIRIGEMVEEQEK